MIRQVTYKMVKGGIWDTIAAEERRHRELLAEELQRLLKKLVELGAEKVILFGSYAQGWADLFTDLDLIAVIDSDLSFFERAAWAYKQLRPRVALDLFLYTPSERNR